MITVIIATTTIRITTITVLQVFLSARWPGFNLGEPRRSAACSARLSSGRASVKELELLHGKQ